MDRVYEKYQEKKKAAKTVKKVRFEESSQDSVTIMGDNQANLVQTVIGKPIEQMPRIQLNRD